MRLFKIFYVVTCTLGLFPLLKLNYFSVLMMVWLVLAIANAVHNKTFGILKTHKYSFIILSFFCLMYVVYLPFAEDFKELSKSIVKSLPFLIFPLGFLLNKEIVTEKLLRTVGKIFIFSIIVLNVLGWINVLDFGWNLAWHQNDFYHPVFRELFFKATSLHLPYLGLLSVFGALWLTFKIFSTKKIGLNLTAIVFIVLSVYIYSARVALICYLVGLLFIIWKSIKNNKVKWLLSAVLPLCAIAFIWFSPIKERYIKDVKKELVLPHKDQQPHEVNYRYGIWYCATNLISDHFFTGVGADKVQQQLNNCYGNFTYKSYEDFTKVTYNSHNQYFDQMLKFGIVGLLLFLVALLYHYPGSSVLYQTFIVITVISLLSENVFDRQIGVVFFSLLNTIFVVLKINTVEKSISS
ncbi:O-antigen ligase family protein [Flavobacterium dauae]|uniref:O-antigen ligase family protein n=1 Tax=Flavobacterium dauae TaxID=1563479 RepID=UPI00101B48F6|nr:O-antigen ligase family protein [Flavobacterium dauae]WLD23665.1 O-antigen ligase family protein [Flavobacterium dauae]